MLQWSYPRLDVNVSKGINHLLKSPLCVHPKTGRICVPIDPTKLNKFNPFNVPTISQICHEMDKIKSELGDSKQRLGIYKIMLMTRTAVTNYWWEYNILYLSSWPSVYMKTSLRPHMEYFTKKFLKLLKQDSPRSKGQFRVPCNVTVDIISPSLPLPLQMIHLAFEPYFHIQSARNAHQINVLSISLINHLIIPIIMVIPGTWPLCIRLVLERKKLR